jgi:hypothetical protein
VDGTRITGVAAPELDVLGQQMLANQPELFGVGRIVRDDRLLSAGRGLGEPVRGALQIERHHLPAPFGDLRLPIPAPSRLTMIVTAVAVTTTSASAVIIPQCLGFIDSLRE